MCSVPVAISNDALMPGRVAARKGLKIQDVGGPICAGDRVTNQEHQSGG